MITKGYPFAIIKLYKKIAKEKSFLAKYFFSLDLFNTIINYVYFLSASSLKDFDNIFREEISVKELIQLLKKLSKQKNIFVEELADFYKNASWELYKNIEDDKNKEIKTPLSDENNYANLFNKLFPKIEQILDELSFLKNYNLIIPFELSQNHKTLSYISCNSDKPVLIKYSLKPDQTFNLKSFHLKKTKNKDSFFELNSKIFTNSQLNTVNKGINYSSEQLLNSMNKFLTGSNLLDLNLKFSEKDITLNKSKFSEVPVLLEPYIERPYISNVIDNFIKENESGYIFFAGPMGSGKTTAIDLYKNINVHLYTTKIKIKENISENLLEISNKIKRRTNFNFATSGNVEHDLKTFFARLGKLSESETKEILVFENIHLLPDINKILQVLPERLPEKVYLLFTLSSPENITLNNIHPKFIYNIPSFTRNELNRFINQYVRNIKIFDAPAIEILEKETHSLPLYIKLTVFEKRNLNIEFVKNKKIDLENTFIEIVKRLEEDKNSRKRINFFLGILAIAKEGFNKAELKSIFPDLSEETIEKYLYSVSDFLFKENGRYKVISKLAGDFFKKLLLSDDDVKYLHNKIIDFFEPWDKKVSSMALKYLPYHYLQSERIEELKKLFETSFIKSKFKIYPNETLTDIKSFIGYFQKKQPENLADITKLCFMYQKLKEETKKELINVIEVCNSGNHARLLTRVEYINKPMEKFYQLLLIANLISHKNPVDAKNIFKTLLLIGEVYINEKNSELIFNLCADMACNGVMDVINLPRSKEDGINLIKNLKETQFTHRIMEIFLRLLDGITSELDKSVMLEEFYSKLCDFSDIDAIEKLIKDSFVIIDKIANIHLKDKLIHSFLVNLMKQPVLINKLMPFILEAKDKIQTDLFKFFFYGNLSIIFLNFNNEKELIKYLFASLELIKNSENANYQNFMFSSLFSSIRVFERTNFYPELLNSIDKTIAELPSDYERLEKSLILLNDFKKIENETDSLKILLNDLALISPDKDISALIPYFLKPINKITDNRKKNPLLKRLISVGRDRGKDFKIFLYSNLLLKFIPSEKYYEMLMNEINSDSSDSFREKAFEIILSNFQSVEEENYSEKLIAFIIKNIFSFNKEETSVNLIIKLINSLNREKKLTNTKKIIDQIYNIYTNITSVNGQFQILNNLSVLLLNIDERNSGLNLLHKLFSNLTKETDENKYQLLNYLLINSLQIRNLNNLNYYLMDLLTNIFNLFQLIKNEEIIAKIINDIFIFLSKTNYSSDLRNLFYKVLETANFISNASIKEKVIETIRRNITLIKDKYHMINILQRTILISEENFSQTNIKIMSLISIAALNEQSGNKDIANRLFITILEELRFLGYEVYVSDVIVYFSNVLSKFTDKTRAVELFKKLVSVENGMQSDKLVSKVFSHIAADIVKTGDLKLILPVLNLLIEKVSKINDENYKTEYIIKLLSCITVFGWSDDSKVLINQIFSFRKEITEHEILINFYKAFIISMNKINSEDMKFFLEQIKESISEISVPHLKLELISTLATAMFKYKGSIESKYLFEDSIRLSETINLIPQKINALANLSLRLLSSDKIDSAKTVIKNILSDIKLVENENERFAYFSRFILKFTQIRTIKGYTDFLSKTFEDSIDFENKDNLFKSYLLLGQIYFKLGEKQLKDDYFNKAQNIINTSNDSVENIEMMISISITMLQSEMKQEGNNILKNIISKIVNKPSKIRAEICVKLFAALAHIGEILYEKKIMEDLLKIIDKIHLEELTDNELYNLAYSYSFKFLNDRFYTVLGYLKSKILRERLISAVVNLARDREDINLLNLLLPHVLDDSKTLDTVLSSLLSSVTDPELTKKITDNIIVY